MDVALEGPFPKAFRWRGQTVPVQAILDWWKETGKWWEGEQERRVVRVLTPLGVYELAGQEAGGRWLLQRVLD